MRYFEQSYLPDWTNVLNDADQFLETTIVTDRIMLFGRQSSMETESLSQTEEDIIVVLRFTANLLRQCFGKECYSSTEVRMNCAHLSRVFYTTTI